MSHTKKPLSILLVLIKSFLFLSSCSNSDSTDQENDPKNVAFRLNEECTIGQVPAWNGEAWTCKDSFRENSNSCNPGQTLRWDGTKWKCADTDSTEAILNSKNCTPGQALRWSGSDWKCQNVASKDTLGDNKSCFPDQGLLWDGTAWACHDIATNDTLGDNKSCKPGQVVRWDGTDWQCKDVLSCRDGKQLKLRADGSFECGAGAGDLYEETTPHVRNITISKSLVTRRTKKLTFTIKKKDPAFFADEISKTYKKNQLEQDAFGNFILPIFGLYSNHENQVTIKIDAPAHAYTVAIKTLPSPASEDFWRERKFNSYITKSANKPSFSFFLLKSSRGSFIMDIDGEFRWNYAVKNSALTSMFKEGKLVTFDRIGLRFIDLNWKKSEAARITSHQYKEIFNHHGISPGKEGYLLQINATGIEDNIQRIESMLMEVDSSGNELRSWDLGEIISEQMQKRGENPDQFVRKEEDWCHLNTAIYSGAADNAIIASCRENFVIKIDYDTKKIIWILGDKEKYWYTFPSLKELAIESDIVPPIGQHSLSLFNKNPRKLMLFNNGHNSNNAPGNAPKGRILPTSASMIYEIDDTSKEAKVIWSYDSGLKSKMRGNIYTSIDNSFSLINYALLNTVHIINHRTKVKLIDLKVPEPTTYAHPWQIAILENSFYK